MKILFLGTGPSREVVRKGRRNTRTNSSAIIFSSDKKLLIDCTPSFEKQIKRENIDDIDAVIISHAHSDAVNGLPQLNKLLKLKNKKIPLYAESQTIKKIKEKFKTLSSLEFTELEPNKPESILGLNVIPFRVIHYEGFPSDGKEFPTIGLRIENKYKIVYAEDMESIPKESEKYFRDLDYLMIDAAMYFDKQIRGHMNVQDAFEVIKKYKPRVGILLQAGRTYPDYEKAVDEIRDKWYEYRGDLKTEIHLSFDGMTVNPDSELSEYKEEFELKQAFGSPGGKSAVAEKIVELIPPHRIYVEPFAGGAAVFFNKPKVEVNVLNDKDPEIAFAYRFIQSINEEKIEKLKQFKLIGSESLFKSLLNLKPKNDVERFYRFIYLTRFSYNNKRKYFSTSDTGKKLNVDKLLELKDKLKDVKIYNKNYREIIKEFDSKDTLFYIDPPYLNWGKSEFKFDLENWKELIETLKGIKGKFVLSFGKDPQLKELVSEFKIKKLITRRSGGTRLREQKKIYTEADYIALNFDYKTDNLIENINEYSPDRVNNKQLADDWRIVNAWYSSKRKGEKIKYSLEEIVNLAKIIYNEIEKRVKKGKMKHEFKPEEMKKYSRELYNIVKSDKEIPEQSEIKQNIEQNTELNKTEVIENVKLKPEKFEDLILIKDCVSVVGSSVKQYDNKHEPNDIDLLIRLDPKYDYLRRAIDTRLSRMHDKIHTIYEPLGPHDDYIPLYDLVLRRVKTDKRSLVEMRQEIDLRSLKIKPLKPVTPMKPQKRFYDVNDVVEYIFN